MAGWAKTAMAGFILHRDGSSLSSFRTFGLRTQSLGTASFPGTSSPLILSASPEFEPIIPDTMALAGFGSVLLLCVAAAYVWAVSVVPVSRTKLARSKQQGGSVRSYLDELAVSPREERNLERWLFTDWLAQGPKTNKPSALPVLKKAKWNSGDNPVLAATALILLGVVFTSVSERVLSIM